jgi:hypothetical protein
LFWIFKKNIFFFFVFKLVNFYVYMYVFIYLCARQEYIVAFTKVLTMYQLYHTWIHSSPPTLLLVLGIFEIGSHKLFGAGFKPWSSWSLPLE